MMAAKISWERIAEIMKTVLQELAAAGGEARVGALIRAAEPKLNLTEYERAVLEKSGYVRWHTVVHFYSIDLVKSGFIKKEGGKWYLTETGRQVLTLPAAELLDKANEGYKRWAAQRGDKPPAKKAVEEEDPEKIERQAAYDQALGQAAAEIEEHISRMGWYDFQTLVGELLVAMGYHVPFIAPLGPDGGVDVVAYKDPLGTTAPRIRVQVKHRGQKVSGNEVRELQGVLKREGDIGLIVSSGGFTAEAEHEIRSSNKHIEAMDLNRLIKLWQEHYEKVREAGKKLLPLVKLYFLAPTEES
jgi:restriction system protein